MTLAPSIFEIFHVRAPRPGSQVKPAMGLAVSARVISEVRHESRIGAGAARAARASR